MLTAENALQILARNAGLGRASFNAEGAAEIVFAEALSIFITRIHEGEMELSCLLPELDGATDKESLSAMLYQNARLPIGRIALEPGSHRALYCARLVLGRCDEAGLVDQANRFAAQAVALRGQSREALRAERPAGPKAALPAEIMRI